MYYSGFYEHFNEILRRAAAGEEFSCAEYAVVFATTHSVADFYQEPVFEP